MLESWYLLVLFKMLSIWLHQLYFEQKRSCSFTLKIPVLGRFAETLKALLKRCRRTDVASVW